ncbi:hypothetical protein [Streptomyces sp. OE57]|uniref:hypothetical protein n=1 Tax=Streptomyces lacaronensis TaxID=3379885 RepID=UPI0039B7613A
MALSRRNRATSVESATGRSPAASGPTWLNTAAITPDFLNDDRIGRALDAIASELLSYDSVAAMNAAGVRFAVPAAAACGDPAVHTAQDLPTATAVEYVAERDACKSPHQRGSRILVHSSANAAGQRAARERKPAKAREDLGCLRRGLGSHHYPDQAEVDARLAAIAHTRRVSAYLRAVTSTAPDGKP